MAVYGNKKDISGETPEEVIEEQQEAPGSALQWKNTETTGSLEPLKNNIPEENTSSQDDDDLDDEVDGAVSRKFLIGLVIAGVGAGVYWFMSNDQQPTTANTGFSAPEQTTTQTPTAAEETPVPRKSTWQPRTQVKEFGNEAEFNEGNLTDVTRQIKDHAVNEQDTTEFFVPVITETDKETGVDTKMTSNGEFIIVEELPPIESNKYEEVDLGGGSTLYRGSARQAHAEQNLSTSEQMDNAAINLGMGVSSGGEAMWAKGKTTNSVESSGRVLVFGGSTDGIFTETPSTVAEEYKEAASEEEVIGGDTVGAAVRGVAGKATDSINDVKRDVVQGATEAVIEATVGNGVKGAIVKHKLGLE